MMPELGKYASAVLGAYGATLLLLAGLVWVSWRAARQAHAALERAEKGRGDGD